jgi:hypothetical protein
MMLMTMMLMLMMMMMMQVYGNEVLSADEAAPFFSLLRDVDDSLLVCRIADLAGIKLERRVELEIGGPSGFQLLASDIHALKCKVRNSILSDRIARRRKKRRRVWLY